MESFNSFKEAAVELSSAGNFLWDPEQLKSKFINNKPERFLTFTGLVVSGEIYILGDELLFSI